MKLKKFVEENIPFDKVEIQASEMVTEAILMYRIVDSKGTVDEDLQERFNYIASVGCSQAMARGIVDIIVDEWIASAVDDVLDKREEDYDDD